MATLPSRKSLENMKRVDLQRICKDYGVKANLKSEALIDLLLDTQKPATRPAPTRRSVSTRRSSRAGPSRISSVIIHDTDDENDDDKQTGDDRHAPEEQLTGHEAHAPSLNGQHEIPPPPATRKRKAKEQTRLGVGRPVAAGGAGPRAVTKSMSVPRAQRNKTSKSMVPHEATILEEEPEPESHGVAAEDNTHEEIPQRDSPHSHDSQVQFSNDSLASLASIDKHVAEALRPLHEQMESLKAELELMQSLKTELGQLKVQVAEMGTLKEKVENLAAEVQNLRNQADAATPIATSQLHDSQVVGGSANANRSPSNATPHHGIGPTILGKRHRDSGDTTGSAEETQSHEPLETDAAQSQTTIRPTRKRPKLTENEDSSGEPAEGAIRHDFQQEAGGDQDPSTMRVPSFTIFNGTDETLDMYIDPPPPIERLSESFIPSSPRAGSGSSLQRPTATSTANASENQPFSFSFLPMSSTPAQAMFMPIFPYPEPPQSPSPAGINSTPGIGHHRGGNRTDMFQAFGLPPPGRPPRSSGSRVGSTSSRFVDPAEIMRRTSNSEEESERTGAHETRMQQDAAAPGAGSSSANAPQMKRTMYGTELDGDTRFGDFGVEGVGNNGSGFWAGGRY